MSAFAAAPLHRGFQDLAARRGAPGERPALRRDLVVRRSVQMGDVKWVVKHPESFRIFTFEDGDWAFIARFDGTRTADEVLEAHRQDAEGAEVPPALALDVLERLRKLDFLDQSTSERNLALLRKFKTARRRRANERAEGFNPFFVPFKVLDPNRFLGETAKYVRWIWRPPAVAVACLSFLFTIGVFAGHFGPIWSQTVELYAFLGKPLRDAVQFLLILTGIGAIHELAHGYVIRFYGGEVHNVGVALLYFVPSFYCDTTDALLFESRWQRLWVTVAGIYIEAILCSFATALWVVSYPDTVLHELAYKTMLFTGISTIFFNINPLIKIDGYHALTSLLGVPDLREESLRYLGALFERHVLRLNVKVPVHSRRKRVIFIVYGPLALAYTGVVMMFVWGLLRNFWSHVDPDLGIAFAVVSIAFLFRTRLRLTARTGRLFYLDKKEFLMSRRARGPILLAAGVLLLGGGMPWYGPAIQLDASLKPIRSIVLGAPADATVVSVLAREEEIVQAGQALAVLVDASAAGKAAGSQRESLTLSSPWPGRVLTRRPENLVGRFVVAGTGVVEVGDCRSLVAELPLSERLLGEVQAGDAVEIQLTARPFETIRGKVVSFAATATPAETGPVPSASPLRPPEVPDRVVVRAEFANTDGRLMAGMGGTARIRGARSAPFAIALRTAGRWLQSTFW